MYIKCIFYIFSNTYTKLLCAVFAGSVHFKAYYFSKLEWITERQRGFEDYNSIENPKERPEDLLRCL